MDTSSRIDWIDTSKGIGIVLVVYGHVIHELVKMSSSAPSLFLFYSERVVYSFHMPLFFFISGCLLRKQIAGKPIRLILTRKISTLLYPYILWSLIQGSIEIFAGRFTGTTVTINEVLSFLWAPRAHFWFIYILFYMTVISSFLSRLPEKQSLLFQYLLCAILILYPIPLAGFSVFYIYFVIGFHCSTAILSFAKKIPPQVVLLSFLIFSLAELLILSYFDYTYRLQYLLAPLGIGMVLIFSNFLSEQEQPRSTIQGMASRLFTDLGKYSLVIYLTHVLAYKALFIIAVLVGITHQAVLLTAGTFFAAVSPVLVYRVAKPLQPQLLFDGRSLISLFRR